MAFRIALVAVLAAVVAGLVLLLNSIDASTGVAVASLGLVVVAGGAAFGYFADRLPELPRIRRAHRLAGIHRSD